MSWLWEVDDLDLRVSFARANGPVDFFTLVVRLVVSRVTAVLTLALSPADKVLRLVGKGLTAVVLGMMLLLIIHGLWFLFWGPLMASSWLWLRYNWVRPLLLLPGIPLAIMSHIFLMLVPDHQKNSKYTLMAREWPLSWRLYRPSQAYFEANPTMQP